MDRSDPFLACSLTRRSATHGALVRSSLRL